jgi:hypothetical protein
MKMLHLQQTHGNFLSFNSDSGIRFVLQFIVDISIQNILICSKIDQNKFIIHISNSHQYQTGNLCSCKEEGCNIPSFYYSQTIRNIPFNLKSLGNIVHCSFMRRNGKNNCAANHDLNTRNSFSVTAVFNKLTFFFRVSDMAEPDLPIHLEAPI